jgi:ankyrin repeat protein
MRTKVSAWTQIAVLAAGCALFVGGCCLFQSHSHFRSVHEAAIDGDVMSVADDLKMRPGDLNLPDDAGQTPLHLASIHCRTNVVELLLDKGANIGAVAKGNATPLHLAAQSGCSAAARLLLSKGASVNARDDEGRTPLGRAKQWNQEELVLLLRQHGGIE